MATRITYTFDNGPWPGATDRLLDFLSDRDIKATFFVVGERLAEPEGRQLAERAAAEGHWVGNHTYTHTVPLGQAGDAERVEHEIGSTEKLMGELAHPRKFFRPSGSGELGPHILSHEALTYLKDKKYTMVTWNSVPRDWIAPHEEWLPRAKADLQNLDWPVLVLHDKFIAEMLDTLAVFHDGLLKKGVEVVQDFNPACLPIKNGEAHQSVMELIAD